MAKRGQEGGEFEPRIQPNVTREQVIDMLNSGFENPLFGFMHKGEGRIDDAQYEANIDDAQYEANLEFYLKVKEEQGK